MNRFLNLGIWLLLGWVVVGSLIIVYYQDVDGVLFNTPITFSVDVQNLKTDKAVYHAGDAISVQFSYCRNRSFTASSQWKLVDDVETIFPESKYVLNPECIKDKWVLIGIIPPDTIEGTHHLEGSTQAQVNSLRTVYYEYRSQDFQII